MHVCGCADAGCWVSAVGCAVSADAWQVQNVMAKAIAVQLLLLLLLRLQHLLPVLLQTVLCIRSKIKQGLLVCIV